MAAAMTAVSSFNLVVNCVCVCVWVCLLWRQAHDREPKGWWISPRVSCAAQVLGHANRLTGALGFSRFSRKDRSKPKTDVWRPASHCTIFLDMRERTSCLQQNASFLRWRRLIVFSLFLNSELVAYWPLFCFDLDVNSPDGTCSSFAISTYRQQTIELR